MKDWEGTPGTLVSNRATELDQHNNQTKPASREQHPAPCVRLIENNQAEHAICLKRQKLQFHHVIKSPGQLQRKLGLLGSAMLCDRLSCTVPKVYKCPARIGATWGIFGISILHSATAATHIQGHLCVLGTKQAFVGSQWTWCLTFGCVPVCDRAGPCHFILSVLGCVACRESNQDNKLQGWFVPSPVLCSSAWRKWDFLIMWDWYR